MILIFQVTTIFFLIGYHERAKNAPLSMPTPTCPHLITNDRGADAMSNEHEIIAHALKHLNYYYYYCSQ